MVCSDGDVRAAVANVFHHGLYDVMSGAWTCGRAQWTNNGMDAEAIYLELCVRADQAVVVTCLTASESDVVPCLLVA